MLVLGLVACETRRERRHSGPSSTTPSVLTRRDLDEWQGRTLYEAMQALRPNFLRRSLRGESPAVLINGQLTGTEALRLHSVAEVVEVRLVREADAAARYGIVHAGPVIVVTLRTLRP
jgi:hypothetical protein